MALVLLILLSTASFLLRWGLLERVGEVGVVLGALLGPEGSGLLPGSSATWASRPWVGGSCRAEPIFGRTARGPGFLSPAVVGGGGSGVWVGAGCGWCSARTLRTA